MRCSKNETIRDSATMGRIAGRGLAALLGLGLCLGSAPASAEPSAQAQVRRLAPQGAGSTAGQATRAPNQARRRLIIAGAATLGGFWTASAITAGVSALQGTKAESTCRLQGLCLHARARRSASPAALVLPLVGPWITVGSTRHTAAEAVGLTALGIGQAIGAGMLIGGVTLPMEVTVHRQRVQMRAAPLVSGDGLGLSVQGSL
jgi:hypothetical protein